MQTTQQFWVQMKRCGIKIFIARVNGLFERFISAVERLTEQGSCELDCTLYRVRTVTQRCGNVTIFYGSGSGSSSNF